MKSATNPRETNSRMGRNEDWRIFIECRVSDQNRNRRGTAELTAMRKEGEVKSRTQASRIWSRYMVITARMGVIDIVQC